MILYTTSLLIFTVLIENSFITYRRPEVINAFVCFNEVNDSWSFEWIKLQSQNQDNIPIFYTKNISITGSIINYKLKFLYYNKSFEETQWKQVLNTNKNFNNSLYYRTEQAIIQLKNDIFWEFYLLLMFMLSIFSTRFMYKVLQRKYFLSILEEEKEESI